MANLGNTIERTMFYGASPNIHEKARKLRLNQTIAENHVWKILKNKNILGLKFRRQHPIGKFIADFYCHQIKLIIEIDGDSHITEKAKEYDEGRTAEFARFGLCVIRFTNQQVENNLGNVKNNIEETCKKLIQVF